jgi:putative oxygen-independent coproporphyrinogen III oxidase
VSESLLEGALSGDALASFGQRPFGMYVHVPWCSSRCGYCDFNTYVPGALANVGPTSFADDAIAEIRLARRSLGEADVPVSTVFFGGGTPTLLPAADLGRILSAIKTEFGLAADVEVTTEANPESVSPDYLTELRQAGFNRVSLGMQSAVASVLQTLDRHHTPGRAIAAAREVFDAGFEQVSLDLIYGSPGETDAQWQESLEAALSTHPTHISAYSLIVETGTAMGRMVARGDLSAPQEDVLATRYEMADEAIRAAGLDWYEVSNWARGGADGSATCRHNMGYWRSDDWWGVGPGAHSHLAGSRWWNVKHPGTYADRLREGSAPVADFEIVSTQNQKVELIMLGLRLREGIPLSIVEPDRQSEAQALASEGILDLLALDRDRLVLTDHGRLLADFAVRQLT